MGAFRFARDPASVESGPDVRQAEPVLPVQPEVPPPARSADLVGVGYPPEPDPRSQARFPVEPFTKYMPT